MMLVRGLKWLQVGILVCVVGLLGSGCVVTPGIMETEEAPSEARRSKKAGAAMADADRSYVWRGFPMPCRSPKDAQILLEKEAPREVRLNEEYVYELRVTNRSKYDVDSITITDTLPQNFKALKFNPMPAAKGSEVKWDLGTISPGQTKLIMVTGKAIAPGRILHTGSAHLSFNFELGPVVDAVEPMLDLRAEGAPDVVISDPIPITLEVRNEGSAPARNVKVDSTLPEGILTQQGKSTIEIAVGTLDPGRVFKVGLSLMATQVGSFKTPFVATADGGMRKTVIVSTSVRKPKLTVLAKAPGKRFVGNIIRYEITVTNVGDADARNVVIREVLAEGTQLASADEGGLAEGNMVLWNIGTLKPKESKKVTARVVAKRIMVARATVDVKADAADSVDAAMVTDILGIPAILLEVGDINDPVPLGETETYVVQVTNQGSLPATRIAVQCTLEDTMEFVKATGATKCRAEGDTLMFEPLPALDPQGRAVWEITVKAVGEGDVRFRISVNSDQLTRPVEESEATHFYQ